MNNADLRHRLYRSSLNVMLYQPDTDPVDMNWTVRDPPETNRTDAVYYEMHRFVRRQGFDVTSFRIVAPSRSSPTGERHFPKVVDAPSSSLDGVQEDFEDSA